MRVHQPQPQRTVQVQQHTEVHAEVYSGYLPPPAIVRAYNDAVPGAGDRILKIVESEVAHRHQMDRDWMDLQRAPFKAETHGRKCALVFALGGLAAGATIAVAVPTVAGAIIGALLGGGTIATVVGVFIKSRRDGPDSHKPQPPKPPEPANKSSETPS